MLNLELQTEEIFTEKIIDQFKKDVKRLRIVTNTMSTPKEVHDITKRGK